MMKISLILLLFFASEMQAEVTDPVTQMDALIVATEASIKRQKALREQLVEYTACEKKATANPDDSQALLELIVAAKTVKKAIHENSLDDYFAPQFVEEINTLAAIQPKQ